MPSMKTCPTILSRQSDLSRELLVHIPQTDMSRGTRETPLSGRFTLRGSKLKAILDPPAVVLALTSVRLPLFYRTILSPTAENSTHRDPRGVSAPSKAFEEPLPTAAPGF